MVIQNWRALPLPREMFECTPASMSNWLFSVSSIECGSNLTGSLNYFFGHTFPSSSRVAGGPYYGPTFSRLPSIYISVRPVLLRLTMLPLLPEGNLGSMLCSGV